MSQPDIQSLHAVTSGYLSNSVLSVDIYIPYDLWEPMLYASIWRFSEDKWLKEHAKRKVLRD